MNLRLKITLISFGVTQSVTLRRVKDTEARSVLAAKSVVQWGPKTDDAS